MKNSIEWSEKRFAFTVDAVDYMVKWSEEMRQRDAVVVWAISIDPQNEIRALLAGEKKHKLTSFAQEDKVRDLKFYWVADEKSLSILRGFCLDQKDGSTSRAIPLNEIRGHDT